MHVGCAELHGVATARLPYLPTYSVMHPDGHARSLLPCWFTNKTAAVQLFVFISKFRQAPT